MILFFNLTTVYRVTLLFYFFKTKILKIDTLPKTVKYACSNLHQTRSRTTYKAELGC